MFKHFTSFHFSFGQEPLYSQHHLFTPDTYQAPIVCQAWFQKIRIWCEQTDKNTGPAHF